MRRYEHWPIIVVSIMLGCSGICSVLIEAEGSIAEHGLISGWSRLALTKLMICFTFVSEGLAAMYRKIKRSVKGDSWRTPGDKYISWPSIVLQVIMGAGLSALSVRLITVGSGGTFSNLFTAIMGAAFAVTAVIYAVKKIRAVEGADEARE